MNDADKRWLHVTLEYATPNGNPAVWAGPLFSTWDDYHEDAKVAARRDRRRIGKVNGSSAVPYAEGYDPTR